MKKINFNLMLKIISSGIILLSCALLVKSVKIYKKYATAKAFYFTSLNEKNTLSVKLKKLESLSQPKAVFGDHSVSTYLLTFLSFSNYINGKGYNGIVYLKAAQGTQVKPGAKPLNVSAPAVTDASYLKLNSYIVPSKSFYGINKVNIIYRIKKYVDIKTILKIIKDIQGLFPVRINNLLLTNKETVINFSIYGGE